MSNLRFCQGCNSGYLSEDGHDCPEKPTAANITADAEIRISVAKPSGLTPVPKWKWPDNNDRKRTEVWLSDKYLVQVFDEGHSLRMSVNRVTVRDDGKWDENLTWDELQEIKGQIGRGKKYAIEIYPRDCDVVNVANMRHLWILPKMLPMGWRASK